MLTRYFTVFLLISLAQANKSKEKDVKDPASSHIERWNKYIDRQFTEPLTFHYLWPWNQLFKAVAALDEDDFNEPKVVSNKDTYEVQLNVKRFKPDELKIRVKNRNIIVEGKHKEEKNNHQFLANHFVQNFVIPLGCKPEEVRAVLKEDGVLSISAPRHEVPPPPPEIEVPIEVLFTEKVSSTSTLPEVSSTEKTEKVETTVTEKKVEAAESSSATPLEQLELVEATTHVGKIRKKELKEPRPSRVNEVSKGVDENGLDYALIDNE